MGGNYASCVNGTQTLKGKKMTLKKTEKKVHNKLRDGWKMVSETGEEQAARTLTPPSPESVALDAPLDYVAADRGPYLIQEDEVLPWWVLVSVLANVFMAAALLALAAYAMSGL